MCKKVQIYNNVPETQFSDTAGGRFVERMEPHKFVNTNLLINIDPLELRNGLYKCSIVSVIMENYFSKNCTT